MNANHLQLYQAVILVIAGAMIYQGLLNFFKQQSGQTVFKLFVRIAVWGGMVVIVIFPQVTNTIASFIGIEGNINAVILTGFIFVFLMIFKLLSAIERVEQQLTTLTRKDALESLSETHERK